MTQPALPKSTKALVVSFDQLALNFLGCYGNQWIESPNFDRLAAEAVVFDAHFGECFSEQAANHAWWTGLYQIAACSNQATQPPSVFQWLQDAGIDVQLVIEDSPQSPASSVVSPPGVIPAITITGSDSPDADHEETPFARLVQYGIDTLPEFFAAKETSSLLWLKSRGVPSVPLPPEPFWSLYDDELEEETEPDTSHQEWQELRMAYAGYVTMLDEWLGRLLDAIETHDQPADCLLIVTAAMGTTDTNTPIRQSAPCRLHEEVVRTPLIVKCYGSRIDASRRSELVQTVDIAPTLIDWFEQPVQSSATLQTPETLQAAQSFPSQGVSLLPLLFDTPAATRDAVYFANTTGSQTATPDEWGLRTNDFHLIVHNDGTGETYEMFVKPDDLWEVNNVAEQYPQVVEDLREKCANWLAREPGQ